MDQLQKKTFQVSRQLTYTYYVSHSTESASSKPTLLLNHGFPDSAHLFQDVLPFLIDSGHQILIPDLLGYGESSKPLDSSLYVLKSIAQDLIEILDVEKISKVVSIGHDWGSSLAARICLFFPERVAAAVFINIAYYPPQRETFNVQERNELTEKVFGYPMFAYWELFTAPDGAKIIDSHLESFWTAMHGNKLGWMKDLFCVRGAMREFLLADRRVPLQPYAEDPKWKTAFLTGFKKDGIAPALNWYFANVTDLNHEAEKDLPKESEVLNMPVLFIGCTGDAVGRIDLIEVPKKAGLLPDLTEKTIETIGHWSPMEKPEEIGNTIAEFLRQKQL
jgi:soluble epoxide hydrolase/lipid-phosphate phosphatase